MRNELQLINHYINSRDVSFLIENDISIDYFTVTHNIVKWIEDYASNNNSLPTLQTLDEKFEDFEIIAELDAIPYLIDEVRNSKLSIEYQPLLMESAEMVAGGRVEEAVNKMRVNLEDLSKKYTGRVTPYDWVKNASDRYEQYLKTHQQEGLIGITSGIKGLDELTGGWMPDDLVLIAGRPGEGKSLVSLYLAYQAWFSFVTAGINDSVVYLSTEMPELKVAYRLDTMRAHFSNTSLNRGELSDIAIYKEYLEELEKKSNSLKIFTEDSNGGRAFTTNDIRSIIEKEKPGLLVIDQIYDILDGTGERDIRKRIVNVSTAVRKLNLNTQTPVIWVAQAGRGAAVEAKRDDKAAPELYQVQESDAPVQKSTTVITLRSINNETIKLSLKKNREGERDKDIYLMADIDKGFYGEIEEEALAF